MAPESSGDLPAGNGMVFLRCTLTPITVGNPGAKTSAAVVVRIRIRKLAHLELSRHFNRLERVFGV